jgi:hypothetical protein
MLLLPMTFAFLSGMLIESVSANMMPYKPPEVSVLSPSPNGTCHISDVPLQVQFRLFGQTPQSLEHLESLNYSLDGQEDVHIPFEYPLSYGPGDYMYANDTLFGLSDGIHSLMVHGETTIGAEKKYFNATISFTVNTTAGQSVEPFPWLPVAVVAAAVIAVATLVYWKKRKQ